MSHFDDRLAQELERAATPVEPAEALEEIDRRRARRAKMRRAQTALLATVVFAGSIGGVLVLNRAFHESVPMRSDAPTVTPSAQRAPGRDIGLAFPLCRLESLGGIDFLGDGADGTAWVGSRLQGGGCPGALSEERVVAVDVDGDGVADSWAGPLARCVGCSPFAVTDLNGDGMRELVVTQEYGAVTDYALFWLEGNWGDGPPTLQPVTMAEAGGLPGLHEGKPVTLVAGGDEGFVSSIRCEGYPAHPVLVITQGTHEIE